MSRRKMSPLCYLFLSAGTIMAIASVGAIAHADYITGVSIEDASSYYDTRIPDDTINGAGLSNGYHITALNGAGSWLTDINLPENDPSITFDLGFNYNLTALHFWNYNEPSVQNRSAKDIEIFTSATETNPTWVSQGIYTFQKAIGELGQYVDPGEETSFVASGVRLVKLQILSNYYGYEYPTTYPTGTYDYNAVTGIGEIRFTGTLVPEPSVIVLLVSGLLGLLAYAWRRRK